MLLTCQRFRIASFLDCGWDILMKNLIVWSLIACLCAFAPLQAQADNNEKLLLKFFGFIDNAPFLERVTNLHTRLFNAPADLGERVLANHIEFYVGSRFVKDGVFIPPSEYSFSDAHLAAFADKTFPSAGCRIERLFFPDGSFAVLLVDATHPVDYDKTLNCIYAAILVGLGETLHGQAVQSNEENLKRIEEIVASMRH